MGAKQCSETALAVMEFLAGTPRPQCCKRYGISTSTLRRALRRIGVNPLPVGRPKVAKNSPVLPENEGKNGPPGGHLVEATALPQAPVAPAG